MDFILSFLLFFFTYPTSSCGHIFSLFYPPHSPDRFSLPPVLEKEWLDIIQDKQIKRQDSKEVLLHGKSCN
jgi:hypothetical protein